MTNKKSEEMAIQIKEHEEIYNNQIEESIHIIQLKQKEYDNLVEQSRRLLLKVDETKKQQIIKAGKLLQRYQLEDKERISRRLQRDFKGYIAPGSVRNVCKEYGWTRTYISEGKYGKKRGAKTSQIESQFNSYQAPEPLTPQDERYLEAHKRETIRNELVDKIVQEWTGVNKFQIADVLDRTPKGKHWAQTLLGESKDYMKDICYKMTLSALHGTLEDLRILEILRAGFSDIALEVYEQRKKTESLESV